MDERRRQHEIDVAMSRLERRLAQGSFPAAPCGALGPAAISSGSVPLDAALGGGFPRGRIVELFGPESSGKTTIALGLIAQAQKAGGVAAFVDAEHALDPAYAIRLGVDTESLLFSQPDHGEHALAITAALVASATVDLVVVDSVAALVPKAELEGEAGDSNPWLHASLMTQALRKLAGSAARTHTCLVFLNQVRRKLGVLFGDPETTTGGRALKFYASVRVDLRPVAALWQGGTVTGSRIRARVVKNKVAEAFREATLELSHVDGISREAGLVDAGLAQHVIEQIAGSLDYGGERLGESPQSARGFLKQHPQVAVRLESDLRRLLGLAVSEAAKPAL